MSPYTVRSVDSFFLTRRRRPFSFLPHFFTESFRSAPFISAPFLTGVPRCRDSSYFLPPASTTVFFRTESSSCCTFLLGPFRLFYAFLLETMISHRTPCAMFYFVHGFASPLPLLPDPRCRAPSAHLLQFDCVYRARSEPKGIVLASLLPPTF